MIPNTLNIFKQLYTYLPPLVPDDVRADMKTALEQLEHNPHLTIEELEETMIAFGKKIWAYRKAFHEMVDVYEGNIGETLLKNNLTPELRHTYEAFIAHGGTYRDFISGGALVEFFDADQRATLHEIVLLIRNVVYQHARQAVLTTDRSTYIKKIEEFECVQQEIEAVLTHLRALADAEQEHPELATEIREHVRGFEYGLAALGSSPNLTQVLQSIDYVAGRKEYKQYRALS